MKAVGIDIGTTTISVAVIETDSQTVVETGTLENNSFIKSEHVWERMQDVGTIVKKALELLDGLLEKYPDISSIGLTGQMHGILYLDGEGKCISPLYTWQDGSGNLPFQDSPSLISWIRQTCGVEVKSGYGLVTHICHCKNLSVPGNCRTFCTISDYLGMILTGRKRPLLHISNAASLGFFDVPRGEFLSSELSAAGVSCGRLPEVTAEFAVLGTYKNIPVTVGIGDNQAGFLGSVGEKEGVFLVNMGTGGQVCVLSEKYFVSRDIEARPFAKGKYLLAGSSLCGGRAYGILEGFFRSYVKAVTGEEYSQYDVMQKLAKAGAEAGASAGAEGTMEVSTLFCGTRWDPYLRGSIINISEDNFTPEGMVYGVLEGMAQELYDMYLQIREGTGFVARQLAASGNGLRKNPVLQKIICEKFRAELSFAQCQEEAAYGAAVSSLLQGSKDWC